MEFKKKWIGPQVLLLGMLSGCAGSGKSSFRIEETNWVPWQCNKTIHNAPSCKDTPQGPQGAGWQQFPPGGTTCAPPNFENSRALAQKACATSQTQCKWDTVADRCVKKSATKSKINSRSNIVPVITIRALI